MKIKITCRPRYNPWLKKYLNTKTFSKILAFGILLNSVPIDSFAGILSEDGRYETFEGSDITINDVLEEDKVDVEVEGNTMVNVANQKDPVPITKKYTVEGTNHIPLQGEYDGKARPVIEGNTLVNLIQQGTVYSNYITIPLKNNTVYTLIPYDNGFYGVFYGGWVENHYSQGIKIFNTGTYQDKNEFRLYRKNSESVFEGDFSNVVLLEGNFLDKPIPDYFEGMKSTFEDQLVTQEMVNSGQEKVENLGKYKVEYKVTGKNKCSNMISGYHYSNNDSLVNDVESSYSPEYIRVYQDQVFISNRINSAILRVCEYDINKNFIQRVNIQNGTYTVPKNVSYIRVSFSNANTLLNNQFQLEEGTISTKYEPYKEYTKTLYLNSPLLKGDTIEEINGELYHVRRSKLETFDCSEDEKWYMCVQSVFNYNIVLSASPEESSLRNIDNLISNSLPVVECDIMRLGSYVSIYKSNLLIRVESTIENTNYETFNNLKSYLQSNPLQVVYRLSEPIYEKISDDNLLLPSYTDGYLDFNTNIPVSKTTFLPFKEKLKYLYPNTKYIIQFNSDTNTSIDITLGETKLVNQEIQKGLNRIAITTPNKITDNNLIVSGIGVNISKVVVCNSDEDFEYFEGIKSAGELESLEITSTNSDNTHSNKIEISINEPLRGLPNGIKDRIVKKNGQWVIERNCDKIVLDGHEKWSLNAEWTNENFLCAYTSNSKRLPSSYILADKFISLKYNETLENSLVNKECLRYDASNNGSIYIFISKTKLESFNIDGLKKWLSENPVTVVYQLETPIYEPLNIDSTINTYLDTTHISTNSTIPANLKVTVDRVANRAKEYSELAKENPTIENIALARMWTNLMRESILKDEFQDSVDSISEIADMTLDRKTASSNLDVYIKSENMLSMNLSTNSITFDDFSGVEDMTKENAVNISINSSLPYNLNAYLVTEIQNGDKSNTMNKDIFSIKDNSELDYQTFTNTIDKVVLKSNCNSGNDKQHDINLKLNGGIAHEKDIYKTTIKFEAEQQ